MIFRKYNYPCRVGWQGIILTLNEEDILAFVRLDGEIVWMKMEKKVFVKTVR